MLKKGEFCVKVLDGPGDVRTAVVAQVESVKKGVVTLVDYDCIHFTDDTGKEVAPAFSGMRSYLVPFEDGQVRYWGFANRKKCE